MTKSLCLKAEGLTNLTPVDETIRSLAAENELLKQSLAAAKLRCRLAEQEAASLHQQRNALETDLAAAEQQLAQLRGEMAAQRQSFQERIQKLETATALVPSEPLPVRSNPPMMALMRRQEEVMEHECVA